jgi:hypothetical protein
LKFDPSLLYEEEVVKAFDHQIEDQEVKFCATSGRPLWKTVEEPVEGFDPDEETIAGYRIIYSTDRYHAVACIICADDTYSNGGNEVDFVQLPKNLAIEKKKMKVALEPFGVWDEEKFGLWAVLYCSY